MMTVSRVAAYFILRVVIGTIAAIGVLALSGVHIHWEWIAGAAIIGAVMVWQHDKDKATK